MKHGRARTFTVRNIGFATVDSLSISIDGAMRETSICSDRGNQYAADGIQQHPDV